MNFEKFMKKVASVFVEAPNQEENSLVSDRLNITKVECSMQEHTRKAELAERRAQEALGRTFVPGITPMERKRLQTEYRNLMGEAKTHICCANQQGDYLSGLKMSETYRRLSDAISNSGIPGSDKLDIDSLTKELQEAQAFLGGLSEEFQKLKNCLDSMTSSLEMGAPQEMSESDRELERLYGEYQNAKTPEEKEAAKAKIIEKNSANFSAVENWL